MLEVVAKSARTDLAYADDRKGLMNEFKFDFWKGDECPSLREGLRYSSSQQFPDFMLKSAVRNTLLMNGSVLELKDSKGGSIASFNSTIPTKTKSLHEIDVINQTDTVSKIVKCKDMPVSQMKDYYDFRRNCFYLVRTHRGNEKVKLSVIHGSFFETIPKETLFYQMFLNALHGNLSNKKVTLSPEVMKEVENALSYMTDQTIIASSQEIEKASVKPRLRIMAEVHSDGNPHGNSYDIPERTFNLIVPQYLFSAELKDKILGANRNLNILEIHHKRNGTHFVFSFPVNR
ncbi:MAG: hypothetical protein RE472_04275 [Thermoplasmatales archaeon]|nr:MAG: hypothetical protein RE472_04275 [Thermoplasmatales archaeon]